MKYIFVLLLASVVFIASCEDKKKASVEKTEIASESLKDSLASEIKKKNQIPSEAPLLESDAYPKITNKNVTEFLSDYGKDNPETKVKLATRLGEIELELFTDTPLHRANFIYLVKQRYFNQTQFHRIVPNFIIQGGNSDDVSVPRKRNLIGNDFLVPEEIIHTHTYGTISGAKEYRENPDKKTAPFEFFIFLGPQSSTAHLNGNYTVFGKVTQGMDVVEKIANLKQDEGEWPLVNVFMNAEILN